MKYRKKPIVIEAVRYEPLASKMPSYVCDCIDGERPKIGRHHIHTLEGAHGLTPGDFMITGIKGEHYPIKPDIFEATYEAVE